MLDITNTTKNKNPVKKSILEKILLDILGNKYELSLVFIGDAKSKSLNKAYRNKTYIPNILSFPIDKTSGEIFINLKQAKRESKEKFYVLFLFIHGCLHLKGLGHGKKMNELEDKYLKNYS